MKIPFVNKNHSSFSCSSNSVSSSTNSTSWAWPSCHQNPKTISFRATITFTNPIHEQEDDEVDPPEIKESIESVIKGLRSSERLIFEIKGESNSILEEATTKRVQEEIEEEAERRKKASCSCPWNQTTLTQTSRDPWRRWLRHTRFTTTGEASSSFLSSS